MKRHIYIAILTTLAIIGLSSCIKDHSSMPVGEVPSLKIEGSGDDTMPEYNFNLGEMATIEPKVTYEKGTSSDLKYIWSVGTLIDGVKGKLEEVSTAAVFNHKFLKGGSYYVHLVVTDGKVGQVIDYRVNINRTFEQGYMITSKDASGKGELSFVKVRTKEEIAAGKAPVVIRHCLESMNEGTVSEDNLVGCTMGSVSFPKRMTRLLVSMDDRAYFVDPNTLAILSEAKFTELFPDFKADFFMPDQTAPYAYSKAMGKFVHLDLTYMFPYEYRLFKGHTFEDFYRCGYTLRGSSRMMTLFVDYTRGEVAKFSAYSTGNYFPGTGDLLKGKKMINVFLGLVQHPTSYIVPVYILTDEGENLVLYKNETNTSLAEQHFKSVTLSKSEELAIPEQGMRFHPSPKYQRYFYSLDSRVYVFVHSNGLTLPRKDQFAIDFGPNEEVTAMATDIPRERLFVGTYDKTTGKGNFYIFNNADVSTDNSGAVTPVEVHKGCAGRISNIFYKPRVSN